MDGSEHNGIVFEGTVEFAVSHGRQKFLAPTSSFHFLHGSVRLVSKIVGLDHHDEFFCKETSNVGVYLPTARAYGIDTLSGAFFLAPLDSQVKTPGFVTRVISIQDALWIHKYIK
jgi:hypothetical protein